MNTPNRREAWIVCLAADFGRIRDNGFQTERDSRCLRAEKNSRANFAIAAPAALVLPLP